MFNSHFALNLSLFCFLLELVFHAAIHHEIRLFYRLPSLFSDPPLNVHDILHSFCRNQKISSILQALCRIPSLLIHRFMSYFGFRFTQYIVQSKPPTSTMPQHQHPPTREDKKTRRQDSEKAYRYETLTLFIS